MCFKYIVLNIYKTVNESNSVRVLVGCKPTSYRFDLDCAFRAVSVKIDKAVL